MYKAAYARRVAGAFALCRRLSKSRGAVAAASLLATFAAYPAAYASSHREAPMIGGMPRLDASDFYMFRSYETGRSNFVTMIANYVPLQDPGGGPNFYDLETQGFYDINFDPVGTGRPAFAYRFRFFRSTRNLSVTVGGVNVPIPLVNDGPISREDQSHQNVYQNYTISLVTFQNGVASETRLKSAAGLDTFRKPNDRIGDKSIPDYGAYAQSHIYNLDVPGCGKGRVFVGQRKDPFVANLGETFDLVNYAHPIGEQFAASAKDDLALKNVTSIALELPTTCLTPTGDPVVGAWTTSSHENADGMSFSQVSRLGNPLVNELVIGLNDKDTFNASLPADDGQFAKYVTNPSVPALIEALFGTKAPTKLPRKDLVAVFLTGVKGLNQPGKITKASEEMRLNTSIPITPAAKQNRLGVIGGDNAGYPNGRRPGDDVVDITLRVAMGKLYNLGLYGKPSDAPSGALEFTDGAFTDASHYANGFPYVRVPLSDSPQPPHL